MVSQFLKDHAVCPRCFGALTSKGGQLSCAPCHQRFPNLSEIPWIFAQPDAAWLDWRQRSEFQLRSYEGEIAKLNMALADTHMLSSTRQRLELAREGLTFNHQALGQLLKPVLHGGGLSLEMHQAVKSQLPLTQTLMSYYTNLHRDWTWGEGEHEAGWRALDELAGEKPVWGRTLVLGAGAGRLAYDLALRGAEVLALDINPLLLLIAQKMTSGEAFEFYEFPIAPASLKQTAMKHKLKAPKGPAQNVEFIFADGLQPPFRDQSFDTVVTPWFVDVVPEELGRLSGRINRLLKEGGRWVNLGPFGFLRAPVGRQYSREEIGEVVSQNGFRVAREMVQEVPYLQSPLSCQKRMEKILFFLGEKTATVPAPPWFRHYPEWLENVELAVPQSDAIKRYAFANQVQLDVLKLIDGKRSLKGIGESFATNHGLGPEDGLAAAATLLRQLLDS